jgi:hypothetical protein
MLIAGNVSTYAYFFPLYPFLPVSCFLHGQPIHNVVEILELKLAVLKNKLLNSEFKYTYTNT